MDFSINKLHKANNNLQFTGLEGALNKKSSFVYKFIPPAHKSNEEVYLEISYLESDPETKGAKKPDEKKFIERKFNGNSPIEISQEILKKESPFGIAYRYKIVNKNGEVRYEQDPFRTMKINNKGDRMNVIEHKNFYGVSPKGGTMRHSFLDSDVRLKGDKMVTAADRDFVRNHFNKLGGSIKGLTYLLNNTDELEPYRYIMTTPDIGADKVSSHRYWPSNQYQCNNLQDFKDFNFELFKKGKGYIADGAFTSQGIQSPLVQHVLKWGEDSPFYNMLKVDGFITLGVLPDIRPDGEAVNPYEHIGVRIVNNPNNKDYDANKSTYIQFFDDRLLSEEKQNDTKNLHFDYDSAPQDHYEITSHQDSVQPYAFEIDAKDKKLKLFKDKNALLLKDISNQEEFLTFPHFKIGKKNEVGGASCWDGNVDIIKMNLSNPKPTQENIQGFKDAREYLFNVASYWSETIQSDLILRTASLKDADKQALAKENDLSDEEYASLKNMLQDFKSVVLKQDKKVQDYVQNFPLQSLETGEDLGAVFAQPQFKKELLTKDVQEKLTSIVDEVITNIIPDKFKDDAQYRTYVTKTLSNEILRYVFAAAICPDSIDEKEKSINLDKLKNVTLKSFLYHTPSSSEEERAQVVKKIKKGISRQKIETIESILEDKLENVSLNDFKLAESIVLHGKGGLNWRFDAAKDIGDLDAVRNGKKFKEIWDGAGADPGVQAFWSEFVGRIKQNHPSAYIINEITSLGEFLNYNDAHNSKIAFDDKLYRAYLDMDSDEKSHYENDVVYGKLVDYINKTSSTTTSEYDKGFNKFSEFVGINPENYNKDGKDLNGDLGRLKGEMESLMKYHQPNTAIFSHMFTSNHDKPAVLHALPLDMEIYLSDNLNSLDDTKKNTIKELIGKNDLNGVCAKAVGVGLAFKKIIDTQFPNEKEALTKALRELVLGYDPKTKKESFKRAENFGVLPYEITIEDMFKKAGISDHSKVLDFHSALLDVPMKLQERLWQVMNACVGTPTLFGGTEFAQTGYETPSKNVYLGIRNEVLHELKEDGRYSDYYNRMSKTSALYQKPELSALRSGTPISLDISASGSKDFWPIYRYDSKGSQTISVISTIGITSKRTPKFSYEQEAKISNHNIQEIPLKQNGKNILEDGTKIGRYIFDGKNYIKDTKNQYEIKNGAIVDETGKEIVLSETVSTFFVKK